jgi:hypothetical protein
MSFRMHGTAYFGSLAILALLAGLAEPGEPESIHFIRDVRPILSNHCFRCHGPDEATREADLRLDTIEGATAGGQGTRAIIPGDPKASTLIERVSEADPDLRMPPREAGPALAKEQIELLRRWIQQGAKYEMHWSFRPVRRPPVPPAKPRCDWPRNAIDAFILDKLAAEGILPSPPATRETLIRRVYLDVLGLPPRPDELQAYLEDDASDAYEQMVDRALSSPHYGERWGRHWLDQARYADTNGYTIDSPRSIWPYRDWVIWALNSDMPFDDFSIQQLAGDLLENPTQEQLVATGFHRNTLVNQEGGTDAEQFRNEAVVDRVNTTGAVWLGLTLGCAQCHTHKFDPITHREYYQFFAFFNSGQDVNQVGPTTSLPSSEQKKRLAAWDEQIREAQAVLQEYDREKSNQLPPEDRHTGKPVEWTTISSLTPSSQAGATFERLDDGSYVVGGTNGDSDIYTLEFPTSLKRVTGVRLEVLTHPSLPKGGPGRAGNGNFVLNEVTLRSDGDLEVPWLHATADHSQKNFEVIGAIDDDPESGWAINVEKGRANVNRTATFIADRLPVPDEGNLILTLRFGPRNPGYNIGRFRIALTDAPPIQLGLPDAERQKLQDVLARHQSERGKFASAIPTTMVMRDLPSPRPTHVLIRGDFLRRGDPVSPDVPAVLPALDDGEAEQPRTRLDLARWLVDPEHPLTARVFVNRVWSRYFPSGLVETENDFGIQGTLPTHPELLDWLAAEFVESGWSMKHVHRLILNSATYRQSSVQRAELQRHDPLNKLLGRQSRLRVEAEIVRDMALSVSGLLHDRIGGRSVYPPQPDGVYAFTQRNAAWPTSTGPDRYRRGMYTFFMRSAPYPLLTTFDTPSFSTVCTNRVRSNTPLQSLTLANDVALFEIAQALGRRLRDAADDDQDRLDHAFRLCFSRLPDPQEASRLSQFLNAQRHEFRADPDAARSVAGIEQNVSAESAGEAAAWTLVARLLLNLDEFITRE